MSSNIGIYLAHVWIISETSTPGVADEFSGSIAPDPLTPGKIYQIQSLIILPGNGKLTKKPFSRDNSRGRGRGSRGSGESGRGSGLRIKDI